MGRILAVLLDDALQMEFDHAKEVPQRQLDYLDDMDARMQHGITLDGEEMSAPDLDARVKFVARNLATALMQGNEGLAVAMCTWLGVRRPELQQVRINVGKLGATIDLDYETPYQKPAPQAQVVHFHPHKLDS